METCSHPRQRSNSDPLRHAGRLLAVGADVRGQHALRQGHTVRRGQGYRLHVTAAPHVHHALLAAVAPLGADGAASAACKAYRIYADRLTAAAILTDPAR